MFSKKMEVSAVRNKILDKNKVAEKEETIPIRRNNRMKINKFYGTEIVLDIDEEEMKEASNQFKFLRRDRGEEVNMAKMHDNIENVHDDGKRNKEETGIDSSSRLKNVVIEPIINIEIDKKPIASIHAGTSPKIEDVRSTADINVVVQPTIDEKRPSASEMSALAPTQPKSSNVVKSLPAANTKKTKSKHEDRITATFKNIFFPFVPKKKIVKITKKKTEAIVRKHVLPFDYPEFFRAEMTLEELRSFHGRVKQLIKYFEEMRPRNGV